MKAVAMELRPNHSIREAITYRQWDNYAKWLEKQNLKTKGRSLSFSSIAMGANNFIIEIQSDLKMIIVRRGWREAMKAKANKPLDKVD